MALSVYIGSSLLNHDRVRIIQRRFLDAGIKITHDWTVHGQVFTDQDLARIGELEEKAVKDCDLFFMIHPARNGTHCELGMARVLNKHIVILEDIAPAEKKTFYYRPPDHPIPINRFQTEDEAISFALTLLGVTK